MGDEVDEEDVMTLGEERPEGTDEKEVIVVGEKGPKKEVAYSMRELERRLAKKGDGSGAKVGRGTPPSRGTMIDWLLSVDEEELARTWGRKGGSSEGRSSSGGESRRREREVEQPGDERKGKGKGKGKTSSKKREEDAEERHVRRQEQGRSK